MTSRATTLIACAAILASLCLALIVQWALLGALSLRANAGDISLQPVFNAEAVKGPSGALIRLDTSRSAAAVQSKELSVNADDALAVILHTGDTVNGQRVAIGWVTLQERRRGPANTTAITRAGKGAQQTIVMLRGHPRWSGNITQMGVGIEPVRARGPDEALSGGLTELNRVELIPATPSGATRLMWNGWFASEKHIVTPRESANRLLPLVIWLALVTVTSIALTAFALRKSPAHRAAALRTCGLLLAGICVAATFAYTQWAGWTLPLIAGLCAAMALMLIERPFALPTFSATASKPSTRVAIIADATRHLDALTARHKSMLSLALALVLALVCAWLSPLVTLVLLPAAGVLLVARFTTSAWATRAAMLALAPVLYVAAVAQNLLPATALFTPLADPTGSLAAVATNASGLPAIALGMIALHRAWPAEATAKRWSLSAVAAAVWALTAALAILAIPKLALLATSSSTFVALFLPFVICVVMAAWPRFQSVAASALATQLIEQKTEADLSTHALALLNGHADRVRTSLTENKVGSARAALRQMQQLASGAYATTSAQLRIALAEGDLTAADIAAVKLTTRPTLSSEDADALLDLALRKDDYGRVIALAPQASANPFNVRALAVAQLMTHGPAEALRPILASANPQWFAREVAELHLLQDEVQATQRALQDSGITLQEPTGQAYISRLGMRVQGPAAHDQAISSLALWHPQVGAAQAAMGELLERGGNVLGARARYQLALKLDATLWPLRYRLNRLESHDNA